MSRGVHPCGPRRAARRRRPTEKRREAGADSGSAPSPRGRSRVDALAATGVCDTGAAIGEGLVGLVGEEERSSGRRKVSGERSVYTRRGVESPPTPAEHHGPASPGSFRGVDSCSVSSSAPSHLLLWVRSGSPGLVANKHLNLPGVCRHASLRDPIWGLEKQIHPCRSDAPTEVSVQRLSHALYEKVFFFICLVI